MYRNGEKDRVWAGVGASEWAKEQRVGASQWAKGQKGRGYENRHLLSRIIRESLKRRQRDLPEEECHVREYKQRIRVWRGD